MKIFFALVLSVFMVSCAVNAPVNIQSTVNDQPKVTFDVKGFDAEDLVLYVDGIRFGSVLQYLSSVSSVRILPGQHEIIVKQGTVIVYEKSDYFGENTLTEIKVVR